MNRAERLTDSQFRFSVLDLEVGPLDIPGALVKVSWVLGAFASLCMVTATAADKAAREEQLGPITGETRAVLKAAKVLGDADGGAVARK